MENQLVSMTAISQNRPKFSVSDQYDFISTRQVIDKMESNGLEVRSINYQRCNNPTNKGFEKHVIRFRHPLFDKVQSVGDTFPELILKNSHNGSAAFKLSIGLYRLVCSNGLTVCEQNFESFRIVHKGDIQKDVIKAIDGCLQQVPQLTTSVKKFNDKILSNEELDHYSKQALKVRFPVLDKNTPRPLDILNIRRKQDSGPKLWNVFNRVQENLIKGFVFETSDFKKKKIKAITAIDKNTIINQELWKLTESMVA